MRPGKVSTSTAAFVGPRRFGPTSGQRVIQVPGVLPPLRSVQGEDRAYRRFSYGGHVGVPWVSVRPGQGVSKLTGALSAW